MNSERVRIVRRAVHGVLLLDKPAGMSSNDALQKAKRLYRAEKAGHTGTLDPLATGLLPLCFGAATKFSQASLDADKAYRATLALGRTTSTGDAEGGIVRERSVEVTAGQIDAVCRRFVGEQMQVPPMHSALKVGGRALYRLAREGREVELVPRAIRIDAIEVGEWQAERLVIDVRCSKGSYIRTLGEDIGEALGCGAHLAALRRTASGALRVEDACSLDALAALDEAGRDALLLPADALLADAPLLRLGADDAGRFLAGVRRRIDAADAQRVRVYGPERGAFLGSARIARGELIAERLLSPLEAGAVARGRTAAAA